MYILQTFFSAEEMSGITENFRLGFGSFVDKVVMPYVSTAPSKYVQLEDNYLYFQIVVSIIHF